MCFGFHGTGTRYWFAYWQYRICDLLATFHMARKQLQLLLVPYVEILPTMLKFRSLPKGRNDEG